MSVPVFNADNDVSGEVELPKIFDTPYRPDVIKRAVIALQTHGFQPQGRDPMAGKRTTAESWGTGRGMSRVPRQRGSSRAAFGVSIVGGHQAFPPKSEKKIRVFLLSSTTFPEMESQHLFVLLMTSTSRPISSCLSMFLGVMEVMLPAPPPS